jgi:hypothetical protein
MTRDMRPFQAGHTYVLPDDAADNLVLAGDAATVASSVFAPDKPAPAAKPARGNYSTRKAAR